MDLPSELTVWIYALSAAFLIGVAKSGVKGLGIFAVTLMALAYGGKVSTGILMPLLVMGDIFAIFYYKRHVVWSLLFKLLPAMAVGVVIGSYIGQFMDEALFKRSMAIIILISVTIMFVWDRRLSHIVPESRFFGYSMGLMAGITTMIGNLAGAFSNVFFLAMRVDKNQFIGTAAYLYFIINLFKLPFHIFYWKTISWSTLAVNIYMFPALALGVLVGIMLLKKINTQLFRKLILILTAIGAVIIMLK